MFVQVHTLRSYASALPNRDLTGLAKRVTYGGAVRQRISSQCIKAALRSATLVWFDPDHGELVPDDLDSLGTAVGAGHSIRSRYILSNRLLPQLNERLRDEEKALALVQALVPLFSEQSGEGPPGFLPQPVVLGDKEVEALVNTMAALAQAGIQPQGLDELITKPRSLAKAHEEVQEAVANLMAVRRHCGLGGALFGRMATSIISSSVEAAISVAHAMTVHPIMATSDYFSVQDDLQAPEQHGAAHTGTAELTSGLFYNYAVVSRPQLAANLGTDNSDVLRRIVAWFIRAFLQVEPAAKRGSTAPYAPIHEAMVEVGRRQPRSLMCAYERAIDPSALGERSLSEEAASRLRRTAEAMDRLMGMPDQRLFLGDIRVEDAPQGTSGIEHLAALAAAAAVCQLAKAPEAA
jgi:CRISPR system Cascade subunit CasC